MLRASPGRLLVPVSTVLKRHFASVIESPVHVTKTGSGVTVVAIEDSAPAASVSLVVKAGPRAETADNTGVAHYLKNFAFKNTTKRTSFRTTREAELLGAVLTANLTRENLILSAEFLPEDLPFFLEILSDTATKTKYNHYEFSDVKKLVNFEKGSSGNLPEVVALDAAHAVAFRNGLGSSLFANSATKVTSEEIVKAFANQVYTAPNITIIGTGLNPTELASLTDQYFQDLSPGDPITYGQTKYFGGDSRISVPSDNNHFVLAFPGAATGTKDFATLQTLRFILDGEPHAKWGAGVTPLAQTASKLSSGTNIRTFNIGYSDAGLFGVYIEGSGAAINTAAQAVAEQLKNASNSLSAEDFKRAVAKAKFDTALSYETRASKTELYGGQISSYGKATPPKVAFDLYDGIKVTDVQSIAQKIIKSKPTAIAVGDTRSLPYADSLSL